MKFDVFAWNEVHNGEEINAPKGKLRLRCSAPAPLYITAFGVEALAGHGTAFEIDLSEAVTFRVEGPKGTRVFRWNPEPTAHQHAGEVYTNIDRMVQESGTVLEVRRALRELEIQRRAVLSEMRAEAARLRPQPVPVLEPDPAPAPAPEPAPVPGEARA